MKDWELVRIIRIGELESHVWRKRQGTRPYYHYVVTVGEGTIPSDFPDAPILFSQRAALAEAREAIDSRGHA